MSWRTDDPRLTEYVMGELTGAEIAEVEAALQAQPELRAAVDEIRKASVQFKAAFQAENKFLLDMDQREKVLGMDAVKKRSSRTFWLSMGSVAAGLAAVVIFTKNNSHHKMSEPMEVVSTEEVVQEFLKQRQELELEEKAAAPKKEMMAKQKDTQQDVRQFMPSGRANFGGSIAASDSKEDAESETVADVAANDYSEGSEESVESISEELDNAPPAAGLGLARSAKKGGAAVHKISLNTTGGEPAQKLLNSLSAKLQACVAKSKPGEMEFQIDPSTKRVAPGKDAIQSAALKICLLRHLNSVTWPGSAAYSVTIGIH